MKNRALNKWQKLSIFKERLYYIIKVLMIFLKKNPYNYNE